MIRLPLPRARYFVPAGLLLRKLAGLPFATMARGASTARLEASLAGRFGVGFGLTLSSYRIGLHLLLRTLELRKGDEVLLPPITVPDAVNAIHVLGLKPVFVDISPDDHNVDLDDLARKVTSRSRVLIMTHLSGIAPDMVRALAAARSYGLALLEDCSQAYGGSCEGRLLGTFGLAGLGSLTPGKNLSAVRGGFLITGDQTVFERLRTRAERELRPPRRRHLLQPWLESVCADLATSPRVFPWLTFPALRTMAALCPDRVAHAAGRGALARTFDLFYDDEPTLRESLPAAFFTWCSDWQAQVGLETLSRLDSGLAERRRLARLLFRRLGHEARRLLPGRLDRFQENTYYHFPLHVPGDRVAFQMELLRRGVDTGGYGLNLCSSEPAFRAYASPTPQAERIKRQTVFLPVHEDFSDEDAIAVADAVNEALSSPPVRSPSRGADRPLAIRTEP